MWHRSERCQSAVLALQPCTEAEHLTQWLQTNGACRNITAAPSVVKVEAVTAACWAACHPVSLLVGRGRTGSTHKAQPNTSRFLSAPGRLRLRTSGKFPREHLYLSFHRRPRRTTDSGTPLYGVPPGAQRSDQPGKLRVDSRGSLSRYCCERY